jgi:hemerythrin-like domain-containing protein
MLLEHEEGRRLVTVIEDTLARHEAGQAPLDDVLGACRDYVDLLRSHIGKETRVLFPMGDAVVDERDDAATVRCFEDAGAALGAGAQDRLADALCAAAEGAP